MNLKRTIAITLAGGAIAAWFSAAMTPSPPLRPVPDALAPQPVDLRGAALAKEIARLREHLRPEQAPRERDRNPFQFRSHARPSAAALPPPNPDGAPATPALAEPPLTLAGLAEDPAPAAPGVNGANDKPVRTAIISGWGQLFLVKEGEHVTDRYKVVAVSADGVELMDLRSGTTRRLALR